MFPPENVAVRALDAKCVLMAQGPDAFSFLQGQFSQDLRACQVGQFGYGLWLNHKGKVEGDSYLLRLDESSWLIVSIYCPVVKIKERLEEFLVADEVEIVDQTSEWVGAEIVPVQPNVGAEKASAFVHTFDGYAFERVLGQGFFWIGREAGREKLSANRPVLAEARRELERIKAGLPKIPVDLGAEDLPQEAGLEAVAVSFNKGCYLGQEVMARMHAMGKAKRRLLRVSGHGVAPMTVPMDLFLGEKRVGELRSVAQADEGAWLGLAMLNLFALKAGDRLALQPAGAAEIEVLAGQIE